ncbi:MAG TPA: hypothetical protein VK892_18670, partial [Pyrinomonadaceae bacterium]|nr:hypothetical protein [Pyrinomonadaceae bacterium]
MFKLTLLFSFLITFGFQIFAQNNAPMLIGRVAINQDQIAFAYAGKIWLVPRSGGAARPLDAAAFDNNPVFSPDGTRLAFSRFNGGDYDVYVAPSDGKGEAKRLTFQAEDDFVTAWTADGREIVFESTRDEENVTRLHKINADGSSTLAESMPLPQAFQGSFSPDGNKIAYNPRTGFGEWRYYRGGSVAPIYINDLKTGAVEKLPNQNFNDRNAMWLGDKIYFLSDRTGIFNLFVYDLKTKQARQLTKFDRQGIRTAAAAKDAIVFVQNGRLHLFDLATNQDKIVNVSVSPDTSELRPRKVNAMR